MMNFEMLDQRVFYAINKTVAYPWLDAAMRSVTWLGEGELIFIAALIIVLFLKKKRISGMLLLAGSTVSYYAVSFLKEQVARPRPFTVLSDVHLVMKANGYSFPSGHATLSFMAAAVLSGCFKRYTAAFFSLAALVALSRVYLGVHYPSDVVSGAALGCFIGYSLVRLADGK
jgi:undecaprenyl-diphosphatase